MNNRFLSSVIITALTLGFSSFTVASGGYGGGGGFGTTAPARQVDHDYEYGKSIFLGRQKDVPKLSYCVEVDGKKVPMKRKTIRQFKKVAYTEFANSLYHCDQPDRLIVQDIDKEKFQYVIYYLNKRFKLYLS